ncbi:gamma carbonic anhydrase family protein [Saccharobesus litoralis]|uniref:Gamma carbonic anhydrase family protein n=1 Tax=Saccharobesus litoralis TaxID=2172099 RepID=A0A2S0VQ60_9ALTE|nr:gamma carbonic anhydrase family protein [Saccharobesus litoralis]AWB66355.1 gamma carbonic anhydrase family protein [Saccharobesus litoralis]
MDNLKSFKGNTPQLAAGVFVDFSAVLYGEIEIGEDSSIWPLVAARGDVNYIKIGARTNIQDGSVLHVTRKSANEGKGYPLIIGDDVTVGHNAMLHGCVLGDRILVGMSATIMDGAIVENDVIVAAGSLVSPNKTLESGYLYRGSPAKQARKLTKDELAFLKQSADNYVVLKNEYLAELNND